MNISVNDMLRYCAIKGAPISGLAIIALKNKWSGRTIIMTEEDSNTELYETIKLEKYRWRHYER